MLRLLCNFLTETGAIVGREGVAKDLYPALVVESRDALHEMGGRVVAEVRREVADA